MDADEEISSLRRRGTSELDRHDTPSSTDEKKMKIGLRPQSSKAKPSPEHQTNSVLVLDPNTYWLTRIVIIRYLAFVYCKYIHTKRWDNLNLY